MNLSVKRLGITPQPALLESSMQCLWQLHRRASARKQTSQSFD